MVTNFSVYAQLRPLRENIRGCHRQFPSHSNLKCLQSNLHFRLLWEVGKFVFLIYFKVTVSSPIMAHVS